VSPEAVVKGLEGEEEGEGEDELACHHRLVVGEGVQRVSSA